VNIQHLTASAPEGPKGLSAVKLQNPRQGGYIGPVHIHALGTEGYDTAVWDHAKSASNDTPSDFRYPVLSSFHRENNDLYSGRLRLQGQGAETPLQLFAHSTSKGASAWLCEMFGAPMPDAPKPAFRVRNDGLIEAWGGTVPVSTQPLRIVQTPMLHAKLPAMEGFSSSEQIVSLAGNAISRSAVVTAGFIRHDGASGLPAGVIADASVVDSAHVAIRFTNIRKDPQPGGAELSFKLIIHDGTEGAVAR
jgi:hypothetical protein